MFKENFIRLCNQKGVSPTLACTAIGLSNATFSCWTDKSIPRKATLMKLADYFGVTVDELLNGSKNPTSDITDDTVETIHELCRQHRTNPHDMCKAIGIHDCFTTQYRTAGDSDNTIHIAEEDLQKIADYFEVSVGYLLGTEQKEKALPSPAQSLNETEAELVKAFRAAAPETQDAVLRVLQIDTERTQRKDT